MAACGERTLFVAVSCGAFDVFESLNAITSKRSACTSSRRHPRAKTHQKRRLSPQLLVNTTERYE